MRARTCSRTKRLKQHNDDDGEKWVAQYKPMDDSILYNL